MMLSARGELWHPEPPVCEMDSRLALAALAQVGETPKPFGEHAGWVRSFPCHVPVLGHSGSPHDLPQCKSC